jgi:hypothetical protein
MKTLVNIASHAQVHMTIKAKHPKPTKSSAEFWARMRLEN